MNKVFTLIHTVIITILIITGIDIYDRILGMLIIIVSYINSFEMIHIKSIDMVRKWSLRIIIETTIILISRLLYLIMVSSKMESLNSFIVIAITLLIFVKVFKSLDRLNKKHKKRR